MAKYIDDRLRAMITEYQSAAEKAYKPFNEDADFWYGKVVACEDILYIIDSLQQAEEEMLGKSLGVAAEESAISQYSMSEIDEELDVVHSRILHEVGFKAGAKWMARQGVTLKVTDDTTWGEVNDFIHRNCDGVKEIQIRKKEESK